MRPEKARARPRWVTFVARLWFVFWVGPLLVGAIAMVLYLLRSAR